MLFVSCVPLLRIRVVRSLLLYVVRYSVRVACLLLPVCCGGGRFLLFDVDCRKFVVVACWLLCCNLLLIVGLCLLSLFIVRCLALFVACCVLLVLCSFFLGGDVRCMSSLIVVGG